jgi:hypothetical protein
MEVVNNDNQGNGNEFIIPFGRWQHSCYILLECDLLSSWH